MARILHPVSRDLYEFVDGLVRVESNGVCGMFKANGDWHSGALRWADPHMCSWLANKGAEVARFAAAADQRGAVTP